MTSTKRALTALATGALALPFIYAPAAYAQTAAPTAQPIAPFCENVPEDFDPFTDDESLPPGFEDAINCIAFADVTTGVTETQYIPQRNVNRDAMASFIARLINRANELEAEGESLNDLPADDDVPQFTDTRGNFHEENIERLADASVVEGGPGNLPATMYAPGGNVTRAQMASFIIRSLEFLTDENFAVTTDYFPDDEGNVHEANINALAAIGVVQGSGGRYNTDLPIDRDNMALFLSRTLAYLAEEGFIDAAPDGEPEPEPDENEVFEVNSTPAGAQTIANVQANPDNTTADNRDFTVAGLDAGEEYRITLVTCDSVTREADGDVVFDDADNDNLADTGNPTADIISVNGAAPTNNTGEGTANTTPVTNSAVATVPANGTITFTIDGDTAECVVPVVYENGFAGNTGSEGGGTSPRLELEADNTPSEDFGLGAQTTFTAPAGPVAGQTVTARPELASATIFQTNASGPNAGTVIRYVFDETVTGRAPNATLFFAYAFDGTRFEGDFANIDPNDNRAVLVRFTDASLTSATGPAGTAQGANNLRVATVEFGAVADDTFQTRQNDALNPIGDAQLNPGTTTGGETRTFQAGRTEGPDLLAVDNFRPDPLNETQTLVDFTFDEAATVTNQGGFHLVLQNGTTDLTGAVQSGSGTTTITVVFQEGPAGNLSTANVARGYVDAGTVSDDVDDATIDNTAGGDGQPVDPAQGNLNPLQAADAGNGGNSDTPDLVSATFDETTATTDDVVIFTFDEAVTLPGGSTGALFGVYDADGNVQFGDAGSAQRSTANNTQVRVEFADLDTATAGGALFDAVGAFVEEGAVQEDTFVGARVNQEDEEGVANSNTDTGGTTSTERTSGPDLTGVAVNPVRDVFGTITSFTATYTFDERLASVSDQQGFHLVLGDGTRLTSSACTVGTVPAAGGGTQTSNTVTCTEFTGTTTQRNQAVLGTVEFNSVVAQDGAPTNPEGAEVVSGATSGQPQQ